MLRRTEPRRRTPLKRTGWLRRAVAKVKRRPRDTGPDNATKIRLVLRSEGWCERCGTREAIHTHHRRPRRAGGSRRWDTNSLPNLTRLCLECHEWTEREPAQALCEGWRLHADERPEIVPVLTRHGLVRLTDSGGWELA